MRVSSLVNEPTDTRRSGVTAWLELSRLSNAPTLITNTLVGVAVPGVVGHTAFAWLDWIIVTIAIICFYAGGMALNDVCDVRADTRERPGRPIPSGRIQRHHALIFVFALFIAGVILIGFRGREAMLIAAGLVAFIALYNLLHKLHWAFSILMGVCRGLVYIIAAAAVIWPLPWDVLLPLAIAMGLYVVGVTWIARDEASPARKVFDPFRRAIAVFLPFVALAPVVIVPSVGAGSGTGASGAASAFQFWPTIAGVIVLIWCAYAGRFLFEPRTDVKRAVLALLAGICLVDGFFLTLLSEPLLALIALVCFALTLLSHRRISGT